MTRGHRAAPRHNATRISEIAFNALPIPRDWSRRRTAYRDPVMQLLASSVLALALIAASPAFAQQEPPARVGRVSFVTGQLGFQAKGDDAAWAAAVTSRVATGGAFWPDPKSRAELRIGSRTIDLAGNTELDITKLDQQVMQLALPVGRVDLHVRTLLEGESIEVDLP